jgi:hypothetical protein
VQNIVLLTRENTEKTTHAAVFLCNRYDEAALFTGFINHLSLADGEKLFARRILMGQEYTLETRTQLVFEDLVNLDDRTIQKMLREVDACVLARALCDADTVVQDKIFRNMSKRAAAMLKEDMEYMGPQNKTNTDIAKNLITNAYESLRTMGIDERIENIFSENIRKKNQSTETTDGDYDNNLWADYDMKKLHVVMVLRGIHDMAETISVMLFDTKESAHNCCEFINKLKTTDGFFVYARQAEQMVEYETEKPLLVHFDRIFDCSDNILEKALAQVGCDIIIKAIKGLDARSTEKLLNTAPEWLAEKVLSELKERQEISKKYKYSFTNLMETKLARQAIVNAINRRIRKYGYSDGEVLKD